MIGMPSDISAPAYDAVANVLARLSEKTRTEQITAAELLKELNAYAKESGLSEEDRVLADRYLMKMWLNEVEVPKERCS